MATTWLIVGSLTTAICTTSKFSIIFLFVYFYAVSFPLKPVLGGVGRLPFVKLAASTEALPMNRLNKTEPAWHYLFVCSAVSIDPFILFSIYTYNSFACAVWRP